MAHTTFRSTTEGKGKDSWEEAKDKGNEALTKGKEAGKEALEAAKEMGEDAFGKVKEAGNAALGKARDAMSSVGEMATETATVAGRKAEDMAAAAGHRIAGLGDTLAARAPHEGIAGTAAQAVADTIKSGGHYLEEHKISGMARDMEQVVKNHPIPALLCVFGIGFCLGRMLKD